MECQNSKWNQWKEKYTSSKGKWKDVMDLNECDLMLWSEINEGKYKYRYILNYEQKGKNVNHKVEFYSYVLQRMHIKIENC